MPELRLFIETLGEKLGVPDPLAHQRPFVGVGRQLVVEATLSVPMHRKHP